MRKVKAKKVGKGMGAPAKWSEDLRAQILKAATEGDFVVDIARRVGVTAQTIWRWANSSDPKVRKEKFGDELREAMMIGAQALLADSREELKNVLGAAAGDGPAVSAANNYAAFNRWLASKHNPKVYGERVQVDQKTEHSFKETRSALRDKILAASLKEGEGSSTDDPE